MLKPGTKMVTFAAPNFRFREDIYKRRYACGMTSFATNDNPRGIH